MDGFRKPMERRTFLSTGIAGGILAVPFSLWKSVALKRPRSNRDFQKDTLLSENPQREFLELLRKYGGEFGKTQGGL
jgi:hypothetical protein